MSMEAARVIERMKREQYVEQEKFWNRSLEAAKEGSRTRQDHAWNHYEMAEAKRDVLWELGLELCTIEEREAARAELDEVRV